MKPMKLFDYLVIQLELLIICSCDTGYQIDRTPVERQGRQLFGFHLWGNTEEPEGNNLTYQAYKSIYQEPDRGFKYNPNYGFEPYWKGGDWVFVTESEKQAELRPGRMCNGVCHYMYTYFGALCGRNKYNVYKNFKNICEMRNSDCKGHTGWRIAYRGNCRDSFVTLNTVSLMLFINLVSFRMRYFNLTTTSTVRIHTIPTMPIYH